MKKLYASFIYSCFAILASAQSHSYFFNNNLNEAGTGPVLTETISCAATNGAFANQLISTVNGSCNTTPQPVFAFTEGGGVVYSNNNFINGTYTIDIFFKFNIVTTSTGYQRIIDFKNSTTDRGLYILNSCLNFYPNGNVGACPYFTSDKFYLITLVRDGVTKDITIYVNGTAFSTYNDAADDYVPATTTTPIILFRDDNAVTCEDAAGSIKYLSIKPATSTAAEVAANFMNICSIVLPLRLVDFYARKENTGIKITWETADESNVQAYILQHSNNAAQFSDLKNVAPKLQQRNSYTAFDQPDFSLNYYRLKIIDANNKVSYSSTVKISDAVAGTLEVFPNPATNLITVKGVPENSLLKLLSADGKLIAVKKATNQSIIFGLENLPAGLYFIQYFDGEKTIHRTILKEVIR